MLKVQLWFIKVKDNQIQDSFSDLKHSSHKKKQLEAKVDGFLQDLNSTQPEDVKFNSEILGDILVSFAATFETDVDKLVDLILEEKSDSINLANLRAKLTSHIIDKQF